MEQNLVEASQTEIQINFALHTKCRASVTLRSLSSTTPIPFKIQTSSPHKFLVRPPTGLIPPLSSATFQIILKPQTHLPPTFPRSPTDRFLIKTKTGDLKLKVAFVGPVLLRHAVSFGDVNAVRNLLKRDKAVLTELSPSESESLLRVAAGFGEKMVDLLLEAGLRTIEESFHVAVGRGNVRELVEYGADKDAKKGKDGRTPLHLAARDGDRRMVEMLVDLGADPTVVDGRGRTAIDDARDKGHVEVMQILERGEPVLTAAAKGDTEHLERLLQKGATPNYSDQYGISPLHIAAIKGHKDAVSVLLQYGADLECTDGEGHTPLHVAVEGGCLDTVEALVNGGANVNAKSSRDATPLQVAKCFGHDHVLRFLVGRGAFSNSSSDPSSLSSTLSSLNT